MLQINDFGKVTQIKMGHEVQGQVLYWTAAYLVDGLLIDTGCSYTAEELAKLLEGHYLKLAVNTHYHEDHIGANHLLMEKFGIRVLASRESVPFIEQRPRLLPYQELVWGYPMPAKVDCLPDRIQTDHFSFDVVETPGHCRGHVAFSQPAEGWCFSGDLFVSRKPRVFRPGEDIAAIARSMKKLVDLRSDRLVLFTASGNVFQDGREALQSCMDYLHELWQEARKLEKQGLSTTATRDRLFGRESVLAGLTDGDMSSENMIRALLRAKTLD